MTFDIAIVLALLLGAVALFATEKLPIDLVALILMSVLLLSGIVSPDEGIAGFSNAATVTVGAMFILSAGLFKTGAVNTIGMRLARLGKRNLWMALLTIMLTVGVVSAFINNTAAVAIFMPIALGIAREAHVSPSKLLMPLSFASMFGGVCTLIGTSTNILVSSIAEKHGQRPFGMFEFAPLGLVMFAAGFLYVAFIGVRLLPSRRTAGDLTQSFRMSHYLTELVLSPESASVGKTIAQSPLVRDFDVAVLEIFRGDVEIVAPDGGTVLRAGDVLRVRCDVGKLAALQNRVGVELRPRVKWRDADLETEEAELVEAVVAPGSALEGKTLKEVGFRNAFGGIVLAVRHRGQLVRERIADMELQAGDALLVELPRDLLDRFKQHHEFVVVSELGLEKFRAKKIPVAVLIVGAVVLAAAFNLTNIVVSAIAGCVLMVLTGCLTLEEAYESVEWRIIFLLAGVLTLGVAMEKTGAAQLLSTAMVSALGRLGPVAMVSAFYLLTSLLTETMSNNATAALLAPIAVVTAQELGVDPRPFLMAVTFAASASFMTPVGYQTNTLIYGPGQYRFTDFLRVGAPLNLLFWLLATFLIPVFWPL